MKFKEIVALATDVKKYVEKHGTLPSKARGISKGKYSYILCKSVLNPNKDIVELNYSYAPNPNGDSINKTLTKKEYQSIASDVNKFVSPNKRLPNYDSFQNKHINIDLVTYCMAKIIVFYGKNNRLPNTCEFKSSVFKSNSSSSSTSKYTTKGGTLCKKLVNIAKMNINNYKDVYNAMMKFTYNFYTNDIKPQAKTLSDKTGNCVDLNQIAYYALKELGYTVQIVRGTIKCDKTYGHVWCRIKINGKWVNFDASAAAKGKSLGTMICGTITSITNINPSWAVSDDGRT